MELVKDEWFDNNVGYRALYTDGLEKQYVIVINEDLEGMQSLFDSQTESLGMLEIRTLGYDFHFDRLHFANGIVEGIEDMFEYRNGFRFPDKEAVLKEFAGEFREVFETNPNIQKDVFKELVDYL
jgi:hypothetical protein